MRFAAGLTLALLLAAGFAADLPGDADRLLVAFSGQVCFFLELFEKKTGKIYMSF